MQLKELLATIAKETNCRQKDVKAIFDSLVDKIKNISVDDHLTIRGFVTITRVKKGGYAKKLPFLRQEPGRIMNVPTYSKLTIKVSPVTKKNSLM